MRRYGPVSLVALLVAMPIGCAPIVPSAMVPTLDGWRALGLTCGEPREDNVPNNLLQWTCRGTVEGIELTAVIDGNRHGVFELVADVPAATDPEAAGETFAALAGATPFLADPCAEVADWIRAEIDNDARTSTSCEGARIFLERDPAWITLEAFPVPQPELSD
jgi:hypothetical protein